MLDLANLWDWAGVNVVNLDFVWKRAYICTFSEHQKACS
jgi:hypothetical protein